ncbi:extracellular solute-binding protein [Cellulomonas soli]|uniref:Spermidine/putrescine ABC transporter substrate-binding protein n=1 Tax=Cellulomonas soli TaxID=931535 RepID=A0A512PHG0_9CELL|nr:extracellular solute-binding protein [Cellulomonas soli]NYI60786.1 putative spermidine/putrescine transport system substrate-binding protein [Cellulomonas soli]GEP70630.1 spermidine/putrescine ABC transporter substrate-binding protein [Cellulomonas soli]
MTRTPLLRLVAVGALAGLALAACGTSDGEVSSDGSGRAAPPSVDALTTLGDGEGEVNILAWAGYAEDGSTDPAVDWVTPFEEQTGCTANVQVADTSDSMFEKMGTGDFDVVSASGDSSLRMIYAGKVAPVTTDLLTNYGDVPDFQKMQAWNSVDGVAYGMPHGWGAQLLAYRTDVVDPAPDSWAVAFEPDSPYAGKITVYDSATDAIAAAAVYLMSTQPDLGIENPYALDQDQFDAAVALLTAQQPQVASYWASYADAQKALENGSTVVGSTWQIIVNLASADGAPVGSVLPQEGATGWADTWMVDAKAQHPNCAYLWMNWVTSPQVQAQVAEWFGEAPANTLACALTTDPTHCDTYHAEDQAYFDRIWFWSTPQSDCLDGRTDVTCVPYSEWGKAWSTVKNG